LPASIAALLCCMCSAGSAHGQRLTTCQRPEAPSAATSGLLQSLLQDNKHIECMWRSAILRTDKQQGNLYHTGHAQQAPNSCNSTDSPCHIV
jgi:hypothetical protein